jgi:hypothetical protein
MSNNYLVITEPADVRTAATRLAAGAPVAHGFGNFYAITARGDGASVRRINLMKGRPAGQVGSVTLPRRRQSRIFAWDALTGGLTREQVEWVMDAFLAVGPFGFRGPASAIVGPQLSSLDGDVRTTQLISPGYACPSQDFLEAAAERVGDDLLYVTSANRSRHVTGADDTPAHWQAGPLRAEFAHATDLVMLAHDDEPKARHRFRYHLPMSTTILAFHRPVVVDGRTCLTLERHGSLHVDDVRTILDACGLGLVIGPRAEVRLPLRIYPRVA